MDQASHGYVTLNSDGTFSYTPNSNYTGSDSFTYRANDNHSLSSSAVTVMLTVTNQAPVATANSYNFPTPAMF